MDIRIQPELDFSAPDDRAHPQTALVPVATLAERRFAGALDAIFLALTGAGFLGLFRSLGGAITFDKMDAIVYLTVLYLFYAQYFFLFTTFAGATPGMQLRSLTVVRLDGSLPETKQLLWRSFGYLLSGATLMLGFSLGALGRGSLHLAGPHFAHVHHRGIARRRGRAVRSSARPPHSRA